MRRQPHPGNKLRRLIVGKRWKDLEQELEAGVDPNSRDENGWSALWYAMPHARPVKLLLQYGADPNIIVKDAPALMMATNYDCGPLIDCLVAAGARVIYRTSWDGSTALHGVVYPPRIESARALLRLGCEVNARNNEGRTVLGEVEFVLGEIERARANGQKLIAESWAYPELRSLFLEHGAVV